MENAQSDFGLTQFCWADCCKSRIEGQQKLASATSGNTSILPMDAIGRPLFAKGGDVDIEFQRS